MKVLTVYLPQWTDEQRKRVCVVLKPGLLICAPSMPTMPTSRPIAVCFGAELLEQSESTTAEMSLVTRLWHILLELIKLASGEIRWERL